MLEFIAVPFLSVTSSTIGCLTSFRRANFLVATASHAAIAGAAFSLFFSKNFLIATTFTLILMTISRLSRDVNVGSVISFGLSMALAAIFLSLSRDKAAFAWQIIFGDILLLTFEDLFLLTLASLFLLIFTSLYLPKLITLSFDEDSAKCFGIKGNVLDLMLIILTAFCTVSAIRAVGAILVYSMFTAPAAASTVFARGIKQTIILSFLISFFSLIFGLVASFHIPIPASAISALIVSFIYLVASLKR